MALFLYLIASFSIITSSTSLNGILDGLTTPIYIDTVYTFTNKEFARGSVYFNRGFDLPINGTVYLGINGGLVNGTINLNGGTVILTQPITLDQFGTFAGNGFMQGSVYYAGAVSYKNKLLNGDGIVKLKSSMTFIALSRAAVIDEGSGTLDLREMGNGSLDINGGRLTLRRFLHSATSPAFIWLTSVDVVSSSNFTTFQTATVYFDGTPSLSTQKSLSFKKISLPGSSKFTIYPNSKVQFEQISMPYAGQRVEVHHSQLDCIRTTTGYIRMITPYAHNLQGEISFDGKCSIGSSTNNILIFDKYAKLEILPGAQLTINPNTHLFIE